MQQDDNNKMDMWNGIQWQVWFDKDQPTTSVVMIVPRNTATDARDWIWDNTGIRARSLRKVIDPVL